MINLLGLIFFIVFSYPISHYLMKKGMVLDLTMPGNEKRYKKLGLLFKIPLINTVVMFIYFVYVLHKFDRI
jgi:hypothetical protein